MKALIQLFALLCFAAIAFACFMLWDATGRHAFTNLPSAELAALSRQEGSLTSLFGGATQPPIDNAFAFGLLPGGVGAEAASALTFAGPALFLTLAAFFRRGKLLRKV